MPPALAASATRCCRGRSAASTAADEAFVLSMQEEPIARCVRAARTDLYNCPVWPFSACVASSVFRSACVACTWLGLGYVEAATRETPMKPDETRRRPTLALGAPATGRAVRTHPGPPLCLALADQIACCVHPRHTAHLALPAPSCATYPATPPPTPRSQACSRHSRSRAARLQVRAPRHLHRRLFSASMASCSVAASSPPCRQW
jgi:hypothetical protein